MSSSDKPGYYLLSDGDRVAVAVSGGKDSLSLLCLLRAWQRRKALSLTAEHLGCNKVAFGHHADDVAQTTLLNLSYHSRLETMIPLV